MIPNCLPKGWLRAPLKRFLSVSSGDMISADEETQDGFPIYGGNGIRGYTDKINTKAPALVIGRVGAKCGNVHLVATDFWASEHALVVYPRRKFDLRYGKYLLSALGLNQFAIRTAQPLINTDAVVTQIGSWPAEIKTQCRIADYLDRETARIDALVAEKEKMLALLEEKRAALISRVVTRGLDENAPLKPSGLDWLGDIPAYWETKKLKHIASLKSGETITADSISDTGDYPVYGGNGFRGFTSEYTHVGDYVLIGRQGALCGNINYASGQFWASEHAVVASIKGDADIFWLGELLRFMNLNRYSQSAAQPGISVEVVENLKIPVPPTNEQVQIALYMKKESDYIEAIREEVSKTTALLKERRAALITAAVTGQIPIEEMRP